jgi:signal transduction histidine kinase
MLGCDANELVGQPVHNLRARLADMPPAFPAEGDFEYQYHRSVGGVLRRYTEHGRVAAEPADGHVVEALITEVVPSSGALPEAAGKLELLSHVSHELRTPLNAILGFAQLIELDKAGNNVQRQEYAAQIQRAGRHLLEVIQETMDFTRLQAGPIDLQLETLSLAKIVRGCLPMVSNQAAQASVRLVNAVMDDAIMVVADRRSLSQALVNLLSNAVKYNRPGGTVYVECDVPGSTVQLRVTDTGIGLSTRQIESLSQPFNRLGMERSDIEGVGLGLVITRRLVEAMGGWISVTSQAGIGSTFQLALPGRRGT